MKKFLQVILLFLVLMSFGQNLKPVAQKVYDYTSANKSFKKYELFTLDNSASKLEKYSKEAKDVSVLKISNQELTKIVNERPEGLELSFPFEGKSITVQLVRNNIFTDDFKVMTNKGEVTNYIPGAYYQGIVKDDPTSVVAFSFFKNDVVGITSVLKTGNIVLGKAINSEDFVTYSDAKLTNKNPFVCGIDEIPENHKLISYNPKSNTSKVVNNCVRVYYEVGYGVYTQNGASNVTTTTNWLTSTFNNVSTLYTNDGLKIAMSTVYIWTTTDPYSGTPSGILSQFRSHTTSFNGDLAQLLRTPATTSIAYLDSLCSTYKYSYCGVNNINKNVPTYTWNVEAMTHEMGHNLGSPHTHACAWNGDNTAIDGCGPAASYSEGCDAELPTNGGTIMSYCHLVSSVGINFANGFGDQPGSLIRNTVESKGCLGTNCTSSCTITVNDLIINSVYGNSVSATIVDGTSTSWTYQLKKTDGTLIASGTTTNKSLAFSSLSPNTYYILGIGSPCSAPTAYQVKKLFLTDGNWCGATFTDTGGASANYTNGETILKTFYPLNANQKLSLTFSEFGLEDGYDYMNVYNGTSTAASLFTGGGSLTGFNIPGPFNATNSSGAITISFTSDEGVTDLGWNAVFNCSVLSVEENSKDPNFVKLYPVPAKNKIFIDAKEPIKNYEIIDASSRIIKSEKNLKSTSISLDLSSLKSGVYIFKITTENNTVVKKVVKE